MYRFARRLSSALPLTVLAAMCLQGAALADCAKALNNNRAFAVAQIEIFNEQSLPLKKQLMMKAAQTSMDAVKSDSDSSDFRPDTNCKNNAAMYYNLVQILAGLNLYSAYGFRVTDPPIATLEAYVGEDELTLDMFKQIITAEMDWYRISKNAVPSATQALAKKYLPKP